MPTMTFYEFAAFLAKDVNYLVYYIKEYKFIIKELTRESIYIQYMKKPYKTGQDILPFIIE